MTKTECYAASRPQEGRSGNEDAFLIGRGAIQCVVLCDGAGNAQRAAKRVLTLFEKLFQDSTPEQIADPHVWDGWIKLLDSALLDGTQSTFVGVAFIDGIAIGACAGDSRAYLLDREGACRILTEGRIRNASAAARQRPSQSGSRSAPETLSCFSLMALGLL